MEAHTAPSLQNIGCEIRRDTKTRRIQVWTSFAPAALVVWGGFALAMSLTAWGFWRMKKFAIALALTAALGATPALAQRDSAVSELSALSALPIAVSVAAPLVLLSAGAAFTVVAVDATSAGTVWVLERASDGARASVTLSSAAVGGVSLVAGATVVAVASTAGWVLSAAGKAIAFIPNEIGRALLHNERVTR